MNDLKEENEKLRDLLKMIYKDIKKGGKNIGGELFDDIDRIIHNNT